MLTNLELYGTNDVPAVPKFVADERINILKIHLEKMRSLPFKNQQPYIENEILKAILFWKRMSNQEETGL